MDPVDNFLVAEKCYFCALRLINTSNMELNTELIYYKLIKAHEKYESQLGLKNFYLYFRVILTGKAF